MLAMTKNVIGVGELAEALVETAMAHQKENLDNCGFKYPMFATLMHVLDKHVIGSGYSPTRYVVMGRRAEECPGGVQRFYQLRAMAESGLTTAGTNIFHEEEMLPYPSEEEILLARVTHEEVMRAARDTAREFVRKVDAMDSQRGGLGEVTRTP